MSERIHCPCLANERPRCGEAKCWHWSDGAHCALCHETGRVQAGTAVKLRRKLDRMTARSRLWKEDTP